MVSSLQVCLANERNLGDLSLGGAIIELDLEEIGYEDWSGEGRDFLQL
jgi:hypothetical protein